MKDKENLSLRGVRFKAEFKSNFYNKDIVTYFDEKIRRKAWLFNM